MTTAEREAFERFRDYYAGAGAPVIRELERRVLGVDYGGNSYTPLDQAHRLLDALALEPTSLLLDIGSGAGWPGLYLAKESECRTVLSDVPTEGLRLALDRAAIEGIDAVAVAASGTDLPFAKDSFDAISHSDVLC